MWERDWPGGNTHDDTVFPEAFERAYRFGKDHKADVINGKEAPTEESSVTAEGLTGDRVRLVGNLKVHIPIDRAAMGLPVANEPCDVAARFTALGMTSHTGVVAPKNLGVPALINGRTAVAYRNKSELLTTDIGSKIRSVVGSSAPKQED